MSPPEAIHREYVKDQLAVNFGVPRASPFPNATSALNLAAAPHIDFRTIRALRKECSETDGMYELVNGRLVYLDPNGEPEPGDPKQGSMQEKCCILLDQKKLDQTRLIETKMKNKDKKKKYKDRQKAKQKAGMLNAHLKKAVSTMGPDSVLVKLIGQSDLVHTIAEHLPTRHQTPNLRGQHSWRYWWCQTMRGLATFSLSLRRSTPVQESFEQGVNHTAKVTLVRTAKYSVLQSTEMLAHKKWRLLIGQLIGSHSRVAHLIMQFCYKPRDDLWLYKFRLMVMLHKCRKNCEKVIRDCVKAIGPRKVRDALDAFVAEKGVSITVDNTVKFEILRQLVANLPDEDQKTKDLRKKVERVWIIITDIEQLRANFEWTPGHGTVDEPNMSVRLRHAVRDLPMSKIWGGQ